MLRVIFSPILSLAVMTNLISFFSGVNFNTLAYNGRTVINRFNLIITRRNNSRYNSLFIFYLTSFLFKKTPVTFIT